MTGLEKILQQIECDTDRICEDIKNRSFQQCKDIINSATAQADDILKKSQIDAEDKQKDIIKRANSAAELERKNIMLSQKQQIIFNMLDNALEYIRKLPDEEYFALINDMIMKYRNDGDGIVYLSSVDLKRLPSDFETVVNDSKKGKLTISQEPLDIDGGFVLRYGDIDINCCFSAIFSAEAERFSDEVSAILFG